MQTADYQHIICSIDTWYYTSSFGRWAADMQLIQTLVQVD